MIEIFTRKVWRKNKNWPSGWEPHHGRRTHVRYVETVEEARDICTEANRHLPRHGTNAYYNFVFHEFTEE